MSYELLKSLHIIFMVTWFSGLFYLPRLFVYHSMTADQIGKDRFKVMEHKLYSYIMTPSMILTVGFGFSLWLKFGIGNGAGWLHAKLTLVVLLVIYHFVCKHYLQIFAKDQNQKTNKFYRIFNEVPTLLFITVIILVVYKPF